MKRMLVLCLQAMLCMLPFNFFAPAGAVTLQQTVIREHAAFNFSAAFMAVGLDGNVYLCNAANGSFLLNYTGYLMRITPGGTAKCNFVLPNAAAQIPAANANGVIAIAHPGGTHLLDLFDDNFNLLATVTDFTSNAPPDVEAGASGDFYALDTNNNRILQIAGYTRSGVAIGQIVNTYNYPAQSASVNEFRVCEASSTFYLWLGGTASQVVAVGFNGTQGVTYNLSNVEEWGDIRDGMDIDNTGLLYSSSNWTTGSIGVWNTSGTQVNTITLTPTPSYSGGYLRIYKNPSTLHYQAFIRKGAGTELFTVYDLGTNPTTTSTATGTTVNANADTLTATYANETWTAGTSGLSYNIALTHTYTNGTIAPAANPVFQVWGRPCDTAVTTNGGNQLSTAYQNFAYSSSAQTINVPSGCAGLYDIKVTPEQAGWQRGTAAEFLLHDIVEIRKPSAPGAISIYTTACNAMAGTVAISNGSANVVGTGTSFTTALAVGNVVLLDGQSNTIASITDNTHLTLSNNAVATASGLPLYLCATSTTNNRLHYNPGDQIPFTVSVRCPSGSLPSSVTIDLTDANSNVIATGTAPISSSQTTAAFFIPSAITSGLNPGAYTLNATNATFTCVPQPLIIGSGLERSPFHLMLYGDYTPALYVDGLLSQERDLVADNAVVLQKTGVNMVVDRLGAYGVSGLFTWPSGQGTDGQDMINTVQSRLSGDPTATDPAKAAPETPPGQTMASYSAGNTEMMCGLMYMDSGLPYGTGSGGQSLAQYQASIETGTNDLLPYAAFRGWTWASEWWNCGSGGTQDGTPDGTENSTEETSYQADEATARSTGVWNTFLDTIANRRFTMGENAWTNFVDTSIMQSNPQLITATAAEFRNKDAFPPNVFSTVDESDLNAQWEQYELAYHIPFNVDYYQRPGGKGWLHPEFFNDNGTGEQILTNAFMGLLRQPYGIGCSTASGGENIFCMNANMMWTPEDPRSAYDGTTSVYRAMNTAIFKAYGPWLTTLAKNSRAAIIVSQRQSEIDNSSQLNVPLYQGRLFEAYIALMHAHYPADLVFTTDITSTSLNGYKAIFLINQNVELDGNSTGNTGGFLQTALTNAYNAGAKIFYDVYNSSNGAGTRDVDNVFSTFGATSLGVTFDQLETLPTEINEYTYISFLAVARSYESTLSTALSSITPPATIGIDEVFTAESDQGQGRYVYVMDNCTPNTSTNGNTTVGIDPANMWKLSNFITSRVPIETTVTLPNITTQTVYDVFAMTSLGTPSGGNVTADLRSLPLRIYAILPKPLDHVQLTGPNTTVTAGQPFNWIVNVCDSTNTPIAASIPVHVQLLAADGVTLLREQYVGVTSAGASGSFVLPANPVGGSPILKATELFTGMSSAQTIAYSAASQGTLPLQGQTGASLNTPVAATLATNGTTPDGSVSAAQNAFGPHVRDIAISSDGSQVLCSTMNWDHNLYAVNLSNGAVNWRQRAGMWYTFAPQATSAGFAVQGFNYNTAEGYGLYLVSPTGNLNMRFNSYGIARRAIAWELTTPGHIEAESDHPNNFTASPDGSWVATAGNLGLAVWNSSGTLWWSQSWPNRQQGRVAALSTTALLVCVGMTVTSYNATTGTQNWQVSLSPDATIIEKVVVSSDGTKVALLSNNLGGCVFVLNTANGSLAATLPTCGQDLGMTSSASLIAVASTNQLKVYSLTSGLQWIFQGDSYLRFPRFSADNTRIVCTSDLGSVDVFDTSGDKLFERDMGALCAAAWVTSGTYAGDLILASWEGTVYHLTTGSYAQAWSTLLTPTATDMRSQLMNSDGAPVTRIACWSNALGANYSITPNLLSPTTSYITYVDDGNSFASFLTSGSSYDPGDAAALVDGSSTPPSSPWVEWENIYRQMMYTQPNYSHIQLDNWNTMMQITGIGLWDDPNNPQSWVSNATLDYWNVSTQAWVTGPPLLSDQATHSHVISPAIQSPRVRITLPSSCPNNIRLGEVVLEGVACGCSHPDVIAGHNVCVLLDKNQFPLNHLVNGYKFVYGGAYSGSMYLEKTDTNVLWPWHPNNPIGAVVQDWDMKIVQTPQNANEFRYLQFAWKAVDAAVTGIAIDIGEQSGSDYASVYCGSYSGESSVATAMRDQVSSSVPTSWTVVTVDLWSLFQSVGGGYVKYITFGSTGGSGEAAFDAIELLKTTTAGIIRPDRQLYHRQTELYRTGQCGADRLIGLRSEIRRQREQSGIL